jgi:hypothetical protein
MGPGRTARFVGPHYKTIGVGKLGNCGDADGALTKLVQMLFQKRPRSGKRSERHLFPGFGILSRPIPQNWNPSPKNPAIFSIFMES